MKSVIREKTGYLFKNDIPKPHSPAYPRGSSSERGQRARTLRGRPEGRGGGGDRGLARCRGDSEAAGTARRRPRPTPRHSNTANAASDAHRRARTARSALAETRRHTPALRVRQNPLSTGGSGGSPHGPPSCRLRATELPRRPRASKMGCKGLHVRLLLPTTQSLRSRASPPSAPSQALK